MLIRAGLMIALFNRRGLDDRNELKGWTVPAIVIPPVFSGACNGVSGETSITRERIIRKAFMPVNIHDSHTVGPVNLPPHPHVAETILIKDARIYKDGTGHLITRCIVALEKSDRAINGPTRRGVIVRDPFGRSAAIAAGADATINEEST